MSKEETKKYNWTILAAEYGCHYTTLKKNCQGIMEQLDKLAGGRKNYRNLSPAQVKLIKAHMG